MADKLSNFGHGFQVKIVSSLLTDKAFLQQVADILLPEFFESEANQWVLFNKNPINNNIYGEREAVNFSQPRFFEDEAQETKDLLSNLLFFPNGPYTSKNYEGKPVSVSSLNGLTDGLYENHIYIKEENQDAVKYESNYVLEILDNLKTMNTTD